jgi:hypothetical protein
MRDELDDATMIHIPRFHYTLGGFEHSFVKQVNLLEKKSRGINLLEIGSRLD